MKRKYNAEDYNIPRSEFVHLIEEWIFDERNRRILIRFLLDGIHYEPLAEEEDLSVQQVKNIVDKCEKQLFKHIP